MKRSTKHKKHKKHKSIGYNQQVFNINNEGSVFHPHTPSQLLFPSPIPSPQGRLYNIDIMYSTCLTRYKTYKEIFFFWSGHQDTTLLCPFFESTPGPMLVMITMENVDWWVP